jgi:UDP-GlcNAc:undecaprenyl-phosphate/decaprenyl-phosphate GlcNAc-1-phosphate transferase
MFLCLAFLALALALAVTPWLARCLTANGVTDRPDGTRKLHTRAVPRLGGLAVFSSFFMAWAAGWIFCAVSGKQMATATLLHILPGLLLVFAVGFMDDLRSVPARYKLTAELIAATVVTAGGIRFGSGADSSIPVILLQALLTVFWIVLCTNAFNLIDGMDGLATGLALILALTLSMHALHSGSAELLAAGLVLSGSLLGFLRHNFFPASIFLGDSGSLTVGFLLSCLGVLWSNQQHTALGRVAPVILFAVPLADVILAVARRFLAGRPVFSPDHDHIHHRLLRAGMRTPHAALRLYLVSIVASAAALICVSSPAGVGAAALIVLGSLALFLVARLRYAEFRAAGVLLSRFSLQRAVAPHLAVEKFRQARIASGEHSPLWPALSQACFDLGFDYVRLSWKGQIFEKHLGVGKQQEEVSLFFSTDRYSLTLRTGTPDDLRHATLTAFVKMLLNELDKDSHAAVPVIREVPEVVKSPSVSAIAN